MRGYVQKTVKNTLYFTVKYHSICEISKDLRDGFESIKVPDPSTGGEVVKHIKRYDTIEAFITAIEWRDTKKQYATRFMSWEVHLLNAEGVPAVLTIPFKSNASDRFMKVAENIDFMRPVEFRAWLDSHGEKEKTAFYIGQRANEADEKSVRVEQKYKKGQMGDCPEAVEELDGWNYSAQLKYLHGQMMNVVIPRVEVANAKRNGSKTAEEENPFGLEDDETDDGIPF